MASLHGVRLGRRFGQLANVPRRLPLRPHMARLHFSHRSLQMSGEAVAVLRSGERGFRRRAERLKPVSVFRPAGATPMSGG